ncbi:MAG: DHA2 family efflux MFS transporter permease subunit [Rhizobiaceae bacterium]|jgi:DHA2 family multidrug resistance protein
MAGAAAVGHAEESAGNRGAITVAVMLATIMQVLDTTIANVALPHMQGSLNAAQDTITWVLTSYIVAAAIMTPVTGWLSDRMGRKNLFLASVAGFTLASLACGIATSLPEMVMYRVFQGLCGAALVPLSQAVLLDINPRERHGQAMAMWGAGIMVAPIIGPTLGGWLTESYNWRWVFLVNLPVGILAFSGILVFLPKEPTRERRFDLFGFAMLSLAIGALQMMLDRGEQLDWFNSAEIWIELALTITGIWVFVIHSLTAEKPFIDIAMFRDRNFSMGLVFIFIIGIVLLASLALLPPLMQSLLDYPVITTGLVMAPRGVGTMISMIIVGRLTRLIDARILVFVGLTLTAYSMHMMSGFSIIMSDWPFITSGVVQGLGMGLVFVPLSTLAFATLPPQYRTDGAGLFSLVRNVGSSIGISVVATILAQMTQVNHAEIGSLLTPFNPNVMNQAPGLLSADPMTLANINGEVTRQAAMIGYLDDFRLMMYVCLAAMPIILLLRSPHKQMSGEAAQAVME